MREDFINWRSVHDTLQCRLADRQQLIDQIARYEQQVINGLPGGEMWLESIRASNTPKIEELNTIIQDLQAEYDRLTAVLLAAGEYLPDLGALGL